MRGGCWKTVVGGLFIGSVCVEGSSTNSLFHVTFCPEHLIPARKTFSDPTTLPKPKSKESLERQKDMAARMGLFLGNRPLGAMIEQILNPSGAVADENGYRERKEIWQGYSAWKCVMELGRLSAYFQEVSQWPFAGGAVSERVQRYRMQARITSLYQMQFGLLLLVLTPEERQALNEVITIRIEDCFTDLERSNSANSIRARFKPIREALFWKIKALTDDNSITEESPVAFLETGDEERIFWKETPLTVVSEALTVWSFFFENMAQFFRREGGNEELAQQYATRAMFVGYYRNAVWSLIDPKKTIQGIQKELMYFRANITLFISDRNNAPLQSAFDFLFERLFSKNLRFINGRINTGDGEKLLTEQEKRALGF